MTGISEYDAVLGHATGDNGYDDEPVSMVEQRYRTVLRLLPAWYRAAREDEMVDTYLGCTTGGTGSDDLRPTWPEVASVAALAVRVRLGGVGASPRVFAWGQAVRLTALLGLLGSAVGSALTVFYLLRLYGVLGAPPDFGLDPDILFGPPGSLDRLWYVIVTGLGVAWIPVFVLLVYGQRAAAKMLAVLAVTPPLITFTASLTAELLDPRPWENTWLLHLLSLLLVLLPVLALLAGFHRDAPLVYDRRPWLIALGGCITVAMIAAALAGQSIFLLSWMDSDGLFALLLIAVGIACIARYLLVPARREPAWPMAILILSVPVLAARLATARYYDLIGAQGAGPGMIVRAQVAALVVLGLVLLVLATRSWRRLPGRDLPV